MRIDILTLFPGMFAPVLGDSMLKIAQEKRLVEFHLHDIRDYSEDKHKKVDDRPYGGGPGMVMKPEPVFRAVEAVEKLSDAPAKRILLTPQGDRLNQRLAGELAREPRLMLICGRYEGFDERIRLGLNVSELSIGDYVLSGGEVAAMVVIEAVVRLVPGVLGDPESAKWESFSDGLLDFPQYTRPPEFRGMKVPDVLLSGDHAKIEQWRLEQARERTKARRSDLLRE
ncbi:MAG: tRNA (guanosine(37)-N1)-methyltransferase TrmD [Planctomycetes bacterium]|nr:tRNA (guanosine(37)-N1)-methyltransferase TrmD [Planctomycetota bacterium]MBM4080845.1 tRNA (guanosine(37)-N1)-methyltransferase TrmD [Planctomycetota bacterium]